jgi:hypothetical protein
VTALLTERDKIMNEIALRARISPLPPMLAKARTLLTRFWAKGSWDTRSEILSAARMLLTLGAAQPALQQARKRGIMAKRSAARPAAPRQREAATREPAETA